MKLKKLLKTMQKRKVPLLISMVLLLSISTMRCAVKIKDETFCSPIPGGLGAVCDNFLSQNQLILDEKGWEQMQAQWVASGNAVECTTSRTLGDIKAEIEKLCSVTKCNYEIQKKVIQGLTKIQGLGKNQLLDGHR